MHNGVQGKAPQSWLPYLHTCFSAPSLNPKKTPRELQDTLQHLCPALPSGICENCFQSKWWSHVAVQVAKDLFSCCSRLVSSALLPVPSPTENTQGLSSTGSVTTGGGAQIKQGGQ